MIVYASPLQFFSVGVFLIKKRECEPILRCPHGIQRFLLVFIFQHTFQRHLDNIRDIAHFVRITGYAYDPNRRLVVVDQEIAAFLDPKVAFVIRDFHAVLMGFDHIVGGFVKAADSGWVHTGDDGPVLVHHIYVVFCVE